MTEAEPRGAHAAIARIEQICQRDPGRGIAPLAQAARGGLLAAARSIAQHPAPHVAVMTGFYVARGRPPAAETDGPVAAAQMAAALKRAGVPARLITDHPCTGAVRAAAQAAGVPPEVPLEALAVDYTDDDLSSILTLWEQSSPAVSHVVAVERVGPAKDGVPYNLRGEEISRHTAPLERLFAAPGRITIGIGDGGNELGMGVLPSALVAASVKGGERIACLTPCHHLIVCGVSNWGGLALMAALALLRPDWRPALSAELMPESHHRVLLATVWDGPAVDGILGQQRLSVDGLPFGEHHQVLQQILEEVTAVPDSSPTP